MAEARDTVVRLREKGVSPTLQYSSYALFLDSNPDPLFLHAHVAVCTCGAALAEGQAGGGKMAALIELIDQNNVIDAVSLTLRAIKSQLQTMRQELSGFERRDETLLLGSIAYQRRAGVGTPTKPTHPTPEGRARLPPLDGSQGGPGPGSSGGAGFEFDSRRSRTTGRMPPAPPRPGRSGPNLALRSAMPGRWASKM